MLMYHGYLVPVNLATMLIAYHAITQLLSVEAI